MWLTSVVASVLPWLWTAAVIVLATTAILGVVPGPLATIGGRLRLIGTVAAAAVAVAGAVWQAPRIGAAANAAMVLGAPVSSERTVQLKSLESQLARLQHSTTMRTIDADTARKFAEYLKNFAGHRVVVSCIPHDVEAYDYATQLVNILRTANWDARGPELTTIFGDLRAMGVNVYDDAPPDSDTAKILLAGFAKFNIPFQTRVATSGAAADSAVELFIGAQPNLHAAVRTDRAAQ
jgi:hypothetical protein